MATSVVQRVVGQLDALPAEGPRRLPVVVPVVQDDRVEVFVLEPRDGVVLTRFMADTSEEAWRKVRRTRRGAELLVEDPKKWPGDVAKDDAPRRADPWCRALAIGFRSGYRTHKHD